MKSFKSRALLIAGLGFAGLWMAGTAVAATRPGSPIPPWSGNNQLFGGTAAINSPGLHSTSCALYTSVNSSSIVGLTTASVSDSSPSNETRYRFRFYLNVDALGTFGLLDGVRIVNVLSASPYPVSGGTRVVFSISLAEAGDNASNIVMTFSAACNDAGKNYRCVATAPVDLQSGDNWFEADIQTGASGTINYWINNSSTTEPSPTGTIGPFDNSEWSVDQVYLGSVSPATTQYISGHHDQNLIIDEFDSRRSTYIGP